MLFRSWKLPLPEFIEVQYKQKFGKARPDEVTTIEEMAVAHLARRAAKKDARTAADSRQEHAAESDAPEN